MALPKNILKQHVGYWLNTLRQRVHLGFETRLAKYDITAAAWRILVSVYDGSAQSVNALARYTDIDKASISRVVEKLVTRGLLTHGAGADLRSGSIALTPEAEALMPNLIKTIKENEQDFFGSLSSDEKTTLIQLLQSLVARTSKKSDEVE